MLTRILTDRAALFGLATKVMQGGAGVVTAVLVLRFFSPEVQGYYYTFASILALQIFLELGLSTVITTFAAHEWTKLSLGVDGRISGERGARDRLGSLARQTTAWYLAGGLLLALMLPAAGFWFFESRNRLDEVDWQHPWLAMCLLSSAYFVLTPAWAILAGCGQIAAVNAYRMIETVIRFSALWACIALGASLWSVVGATLLTVASGIVFLIVRYRRLIGALLTEVPGQRINWLKELLPLQLRIGLSWISGYFVFSLFTPAMFYFLGPAEAGRMGMTWAIIGGLSGVAATWLQAQTPALSMMVARKDFAALDQTALRTAFIGMLIFLLGSGIGLVALALLDTHYPDLAGRILPIGVVVVFLFAELLHQASMAQSTYLRAFKQEPFLAVSVTSALVVGGVTLWLTPELGGYGPALGYLTGVVIALAWGTRIFWEKRKQWTTATSTV